MLKVFMMTESKISGLKPHKVCQHKSRYRGFYSELSGKQRKIVRKLKGSSVIFNNPNWR